MTTVKHLKDLISQRSRRKLFLLEMNRMIPALILSSLIGTYLDLYFVGIGMYSFPKRMLPDVFSINILFTLIALPLFTAIYLLVMKRINVWKKAGFILFLSLLIACLEKRSEEIGFFIHHESWNHWFSFCGYGLFLIGIYLVDSIYVRKR